MFVFVISEGNCTYSPLAEGIKVLSTTLDRFLSPPHLAPQHIFIYLFIYGEKKTHTFCRIIKHCCINKVRRSNERGDSG